MTLARAGCVAAFAMSASCGVVVGLDKTYATVPCLDDCVDAADARVSDGGNAPGPFCATKDGSMGWSFDEPPFITGPDLTSQGPNGAVTLTQNDPVSPPNALAVAFTTDAFVGLVHEQVGASDHVSCAFDVRIDSAGMIDIMIAELRGTSSGTNRINLQPSGEEISFRLATVQHGDPVARPIGRFPLARWVHVELDVNGSNLMATGYVEGSKASAMLDLDAGPWTLNQVSIGAGTQDSPTEWHLSFDNFCCTGF
jgi:hypothetical protein